MTAKAAHRPRTPFIGIGIGILAVSTASLFIRYAQADGAPSLVIAAYRLAIATIVLTPVVLWRHRVELSRLTPRQWGLALTSGAFLGVHFATWITSLAYTSIASSVVLVSSNPLFVALISALVLREPLSRPVFAGMGLTLAGAIVVALSDVCTANGCPSLAEFVRGPAFLGDVLALGGAVAGAVYFSAGRVLRASMSLAAYIYLTYGTAALLLAATVLFAGLPATGYAPQTYMWFALLALVPQLVGHSAFNWALKYLPATYVSVTVLGEPVGSILLAMALLSEVPTPLKLAGSALILGGILVASSRVSIAPRTSDPSDEAAPLQG